MPESTSSDDRHAVSPVVAVILLVAVTVTLSAVIGGFALNLGQETTSSTSQSSSIGVSTSQANGTVTATVVTGSADKLTLRTSNGSTNSIPNPSPGDKVSISANASEDITIISTTDGDSTVVTSTTVSDDTSSGSSGPLAPTDGLVVHFPFNGTSGSATDATGNGHDGAVNDTNRGVAGISNTAFEFLGDGSYSTVKSDSLNPPTVTTTVWVYWGGSYNLGNTQIVVNEENQYEFGIADGTTGTATGNLTYAVESSSTGTQWEWIDTNYTVPRESWRHVALVYNGSHAKMYVNGTKVFTKHHGYTLNQSSNPFRVGNRGIANRPFNGTIDEVRVYNRSLNQSEINDIYRSEK